MSAPTVTVGTPPPNVARPYRTGVTAETTAALMTAAVANPGQWVQVTDIDAKIAQKVKARLIQRFGDQVTVRYARCRAYGTSGHRDLYVRLCCAATVQTDTPTEPLPFHLRAWFPREVAA